jgi:hypothetical protein
VGQLSPFQLCTHCIACGVPLRGGATRHAAVCPIRADIAERFPDYEQPPPPDPEDVPAEDEEPNLP